MKRFIAPLRLSLVGGGTDVPPFCDMSGSKVINFAISTFIQAHLKTLDNSTTPQIKVIIEDFNGIPEENSDFGNLLGRELFSIFKIQEPLALKIKNPVRKGSGLGTSSAMILAAIHAVSEYLEFNLQDEKKLDLAWNVERNNMGIPGGFQDFYPAMYGGLNLISKEAGSERIKVERLDVSKSFALRLCQSICVIEVGVERDSQSIISDQASRAKIPNSMTQKALKEQLRLVAEMKEALFKEDLEHVILIVEEAAYWKKRFSPLISNSTTEEIEKNLRTIGGKGVKISGAGGGGHMYCFFPEGIPQDLELRFSKSMKRLPIFIENQGIRELP